VVPGHVTKVWEDGRFAEVIKYISAQKGLMPCLAGSGDDRNKINDIVKMSGVKCVDLAGKTSLGMLYYFSRRADIFVGVDSGPAHIAAAAGAPCVILFSGVNDPDEWAPRGKNVRIVYPGPGKDLSFVEVGEVVRVIDGTLRGMRDAG